MKKGLLMSDISTRSLEIGERIRTLRKKQQKTQQYFADMLYISPSYLALIEAGKRTPTLEVIIQIAKLCDTSVDYLLFGENSHEYDELHQKLQRLLDDYSEDQVNKALKLAEYYLQLENNSDF